MYLYILCTFIFNRIYCIFRDHKDRVRGEGLSRRRAQSGSSNHSADFEELGLHSHGTTSHRNSIDESHTHGQVQTHTQAHGHGTSIYPGIGLGGHSVSTSDMDVRTPLGVIYETGDEESTVHNPVHERAGPTPPSALGDNYEKHL